MLELYLSTDGKHTVHATAQTPDSSVRLIATLRADYFDRPLAYPGFDDAIHGRTVALGAMSPQELADAVRLPACAVGVQIEPAVVDGAAIDYNDKR